MWKSSSGMNTYHCTCRGLHLDPADFIAMRNIKKIAILYHADEGADATITVSPTLPTWSTILCHTKLQYSHHGLTVVRWKIGHVYLLCSNLHPLFYTTVPKVKACEEWSATLPTGYLCLFYPSLNGRRLKLCLVSQKKTNSEECCPASLLGHAQGHSSCETAQKLCWA